jgi:hypothetical protein
MSTNKVTQSIIGMQFGMGGPYKLVSEPGPEIREAAIRYTRLKARQDRLLTTARYKIAEGLPHEAESLAIDAMGDEVMLAAAAAASAMYGTGHRWSVLVLEGRYLYLDRGMDEEGRRYEPQLRTDDFSETTRCDGCDSTGRRTYLRDLGRQTCFTCNGRGYFKLPLPEVVRRAVDAYVAIRNREIKAKAEAEMRKQAEAFDSDEVTAVVEVHARVE